MEMFNKCMEELWKKKGTKYEFIVKGGFDFKNALFCLFNSVWKNEVIPTNWRRTMLIQIYKSKGCFQDLTSFRNIHLKEDIVKFFGALVMREAQDTLNKNISKFQIGAKSGHRASEHIYVLKTVLRKYEKLNSL